MLDGRVIAPAAKDVSHGGSFSQCVDWYGIEPGDVEALLRAAVRLIRYHGWTQKEGARLSDGSKCEFDDPNAARFSVNGAMMRAQQELGLDWTHAKAAGAIFREAVGMSGLEFNETRGRTPLEVRDAFSAALWRVLHPENEEAA